MTEQDKRLQLIEPDRRSQLLTQFYSLKDTINRFYNVDGKRQLYPPKGFSRSGTPRAENISPRQYRNDGFLLIPEAIAVHILADEAFKYASEKNIDNRLDNDLIDGFGSFGDMLGEATSVRSKVTKNLSLVEEYGPAFKADGGQMGENVTKKMFDRYTESLKRDETSIFGEQDKKIIEARKKKRIEGAKLARNTYMEVLNMSNESYYSTTKPK